MQPLFALAGGVHAIYILLLRRTVRPLEANRTQNLIHFVV